MSAATVLDDLRRRLVHGDVRLPAVLISLLLSVWLVYVDGVVNNDGILYLKAARAFARGDAAAAAQIYTWPFYSWLIAAFHQATGLGLETAAHIIDALFGALLVYAFITLVALFDKRRGTLICAAVVILLWPALNKYRAEVIRDVAYWACYLSALVFFLRFYARPAAFHLAIAWGVAMVAGSLFRIEGMVLLIALPLVLLFDGRSPVMARMRHFLMAESVLLGCALAIACYWMAQPGDVIFSGRLAEPMEWLQRLPQLFSDELSARAHTVERTLLSEYSSGYAMGAVLLTLGLIIVGDFISNIEVLHLFLAGYPFVFRDFRESLRFKRVLLWVALLNLAVIFIFALEYFFLIGRYIMPLSLLALVFAPIGLMRLYERWTAMRREGVAWRRNWLFVVVCLGFAVALVDSTYSLGPSKQYLREGGLWIQANVSRPARILMNSEIAAFYAGRYAFPQRGFDASMKQERWKEFEYVGYAVSHRDKEKAESMRATLGGKEPVARFANERGDQLLIFAGGKALPAAP